MSLISEGFYLETPVFRCIGLDGYSTETEAAGFIMQLVTDGSDWVRLRSKVFDNWVTQWTVLERDEYGNPVQVGCLEFDGEMQVISAGGVIDSGP